MHRFFLFLACVTVLFLNADNAFAQFTTRQTSAVQSGNANAGSANGSLRFTRSSSEGRSATGATSFTNRTGTAVQKPASAATNSSAQNAKIRTKQAAKGTKGASESDEDLDMPNFSAVAPKGAKDMSSAQKILLIEEYIRKNQQEKEAKRQAEEARKAAIAKKIAEETPSPGMVFDENGIERPIPKGEVLLYVSDFEQGVSYDRVYCSLNVTLQNRTNTKLEDLNLDVSWPSYTTTLTFSNVAPNAVVTEGLFMFSKNCPSLRAKPRMQPTYCALGPMKEGACNQYVVLK